MFKLTNEWMPLKADETVEELICKMAYTSKGKIQVQEQKRQNMENIEKNKETMQNVVKHLTHVWFKSQEGRNNEAENTSEEIVADIIPKWETTISSSFKNQYKPKRKKWRKA